LSIVRNAIGKARNPSTIDAVHICDVKVILKIPASPHRDISLDVM
jgi:hypothetical protein